MTKAATRGQRLSVSFSPEQVIWLNEVLTLALRCNDFGTLMRMEHSTRVHRVVLTSAQKAASISRHKPSEPLGEPPAGKRKPMLAAYCHRGHPFSADNTRHYTYKGRPRRECLTCAKAARARVAERHSAGLQPQQQESTP